MDTGSASTGQINNSRIPNKTDLARSISPPYGEIDIIELRNAKTQYPVPGMSVSTVKQSLCENAQNIGTIPPGGATSTARTFTGNIGEPTMCHPGLRLLSMPTTGLPIISNVVSFIDRMKNPSPGSIVSNRS